MSTRKQKGRDFLGIDDTDGGEELTDRCILMYIITPNPPPDAGLGLRTSPREDHDN